MEAKIVCGTRKKSGKICTSHVWVHPYLGILQCKDNRHHKDIWPDGMDELLAALENNPELLDQQE
jgi:hypothetical protein